MVIFHNKLHSVAPGWIAWDGMSLTAGDFLEIAEGHHSEEEESKGTLGREFGGGGWHGLPVWVVSFSQRGSLWISEL